MKREFDTSPLEKIFEGNFLDGGTIEANLLAGLDYKMPTINVAAIEGRERVFQPNTTQVYNLSSTFVTPDLDSFKASEYQIQQEQLEQLRRMKGRREKTSSTLILVVFSYRKKHQFSIWTGFKIIFNS